MLSEQKLLLNQEDYLAKEKHQILTLNILFSILSIIFIFAEIVCSFMMNSLYSRSIPLILGILSIFGLILASVALIWSVWLRRKLSNSKEKWGESTDSGLARILLLFSVLEFLGLLALTFILHLWSSRGYDLSLADSPNSNQQHYKDQWSKLSLATTVFSFLNMVVLVYMIYTFFVCCGSPNTIRIVLYFSGILQIVFGFAVLNYVKLVFQYYNNPTVGSFMHMSLYGSLAFLVVVAILTTIALYYINYHRERSEYLMVGTVLVIILLALLALGGAIYREALTIHQSFNTDCRTYLSEFSYDDISTYGCTPKYVEYGQEYLNCSDSEQVLVWEREISGKENNQKNTLGCLNMNCCNVIGDIYEVNILKLESFNILLVCSMFLSISASFFLTNKYSGERSLKKALEYVFMVSLLLLLILGFTTLFLFSLTLPQEKTMISVDSTEFSKSSTKANYTLSSLMLPSSSCSLIKNYQPTYNLSNVFPNNLLNETGVRTIIIVDNAQLWYDTNYSFIEIQMFEKSTITKVFPTIDFTNKDLLGFQGNGSSMQTFVDGKIYLCANSLVTPIYLEYFIATVNLTSNVADNSTLTWTYGTNAESYLEVSHKKSNLNISQSNSTNLTALQAQLTSLKFGDLTINTYSISKEALLANVSLKIYSGYSTSCSESSKEPLIRVSTDESGVALIYNLPYGKYTIVGASNSSKSNCLQVNVNMDNVNVSLYLVEAFEANQIAVLMTYSGSLDIKLFGTYDISEFDKCLVGYFDDVCTGVSFKLLNDSNSKAQLVQINSLGNYEYLFFVKRELSWSQYKYRLANESGLNSDFFSAQFTMKAFVNEIQFPVAENSYTGSYINNTMVNATHLAYLGYCVDGSSSDLVKFKGSFWSSNDTFPEATEVC